MIFLCIFDVFRPLSSIRHWLRCLIQTYQLGMKSSHIHAMLQLFAMRLPKSNLDLIARLHHDLCFCDELVICVVPFHSTEALEQPYKRIRHFGQPVIPVSF
jgi:hypothetical protein